MSRLFAIGDIHGCSKTFRKLLFEELCIEMTDEIYCVGDYIDRGPDSKGVLDLIIFLRSEGYIIHTLRGNHEQMMIDCFDKETPMGLWMKNGGGDTLKSFNISTLRKIDPIYFEFLNQTKYYFDTPKYIFVHAGLNFSNNDLFEDKEAMLWTRNMEIDKDKLKSKILIHGHTPKPFQYMMSQLSTPGISVLDVDGGCVYKNIPGMGNLFALNLTEMKLISVINIDF